MGWSNETINNRWMSKVHALNVLSQHKNWDNVKIYTSNLCVRCVGCWHWYVSKIKWQMMFWVDKICMIVVFGEVKSIFDTQWSTLFNGMGLSRPKHASDTRLHDFNIIDISTLFFSPCWLIDTINGRYTFGNGSQFRLGDLRKLHGDHQKFKFSWNAAKKRNSKNNKWYPKSLFVFCFFFSSSSLCRLYLGHSKRSTEFGREWWNHK